MNPYLKQRLVGATVLIVVGIIILPMVLDKPARRDVEPEVTNIELIPYREKQLSQRSVQTIPAEVSARYEAAEKAANKQQDLALSAQKKSKPAQQPNVVNKRREEPTKATNHNKEPVQWAVQLGSFSSKENADRLVNRLKSQKLPAYYENVDSKGKVVYRVRVGPFASKLKTESMKQKLDQKEKLKTLIVTLH